MNLRLIQLRDALVDSFWFVPLLMALGAGGMALGSVAVDHAIGGGWVQNFGWVWSGGAEGARGVLSVVAGSIMTVVSIVFSLTVTTLAQTSSHYGPRVLRNFTTDRFVQITLGTFVATFVYSLLILRTVRSVEEAIFVPYLSVNLGIVFALSSLAILIFFIHHVALSIQAETLIADVGEDFLQTLPRLFPERIGASYEAGESRVSDEDVPSHTQWQKAHPVGASADGYVQNVDHERLLKLATEENLIIRLERRPGDFVASESPLARVLSAAIVGDDVAKRLRSCFSLGRHRTPYQDALYIVQQLVEIAAHALSPGINEPFTAFTCIDWLGAALRGVAAREIPSSLRRDENGRLRVVASPMQFDELAHAIIAPLRLYGATHPQVMERLLRVIADVAPAIHRESDRTTLIEHTRLIAADAQQIHNDADRRRVHEAHLETLRALLGN